MEPKWPQHSCNGEIGAFDRFFRFHQFEGKQGILHGMRLRRKCTDNKNGENKPFGTLLKEYMEEYDKPRAFAYEKYCGHGLGSLMKAATEEKAKATKHTMANDLITLFSNFSITNPPEPKCMRDKVLDKETSNKLSKAIADAAFLVELENIHKVFEDQDRYAFPNKVDKKQMVKRVSGDVKEKFLKLDGKKVLEELTARMEKQGKEPGFNKETHSEVANVIEDVLSEHDHNRLDHKTKDAISILCSLIGENVREEMAQNLNRTLALTAMRKEIPAVAHEPCFGAHGHA